MGSLERDCIEPHQFFLDLSKVEKRKCTGTITLIKDLSFGTGMVDHEEKGIIKSQNFFLIFISFMRLVIFLVSVLGIKCGASCKLDKSCTLSYIQALYEVIFNVILHYLQIVSFK